MLLSFAACKSPKESQSHTFPKVTDEMMETAIIYEANIRQYSPEGTFEAFTKDIPSLKEMGVKIIWLMPIHPISETKRKATGDTFVSDIEDVEEQKKYLGSYYAVSDYRGVNPEFGSLEDLRKLVKVAHDNDMFVILDWVPNHTGWDHQWITEHPEFYTKNAAGQITDPLNENGEPVGWADVADLDYSNESLREAMISDMKYWITDEEIDGFRCDVAGSVPVEFWEQAIPQLRKEKDIFMLAEAWEPELLKGKNLFDMCYGWENHFLMVEIAQGKKSVKDWDNYIVKMDTVYEKDDILMNFITNHDENSWKGTVEESFGKADELMTALAYLNPGMPLIYSGQEYDLDHRLKFFEKDEINKTKGKFYPILEKLGKLKQSSKAMHGGKNAASYSRMATDNDEKVLAFVREKDGESLVFVGNLTSEPVSVTIPLEGSFTDYMSGGAKEWKKDDVLHLEPWQYFILK